MLPICAKLEQDIATSWRARRKLMFWRSWEWRDSPAWDRSSSAPTTLLGLISFPDIGKDECRAGPSRRAPRPPSAGKIHSDIVAGGLHPGGGHRYEDMIACGSVNAAMEKGLLRSEGKEYVVQDGDMVYFGSTYDEEAERLAAYAACTPTC